MKIKTRRIKSRRMKSRKMKSRRMKSRKINRKSNTKRNRKFNTRLYRKQRGGDEDEDDEYDDEVTKKNKQYARKIRDDIKSAFSKYANLPITIYISLGHNYDDDTKPTIEFDILKQGTFSSLKEQTCFQSVIYPFQKSTMLSKYPIIQIGSSCSIYVKPCDQLSVSTILKELKPILERYRINEVNVGDSTIFLYTNETRDQEINFPTKYLYKMRYNKDFYCYYLFGNSNYTGLPLSELSSDILQEISSLNLNLPVTITNTSQLGEFLQKKVASFCVDKFINDDGQLVCVVVNEQWQNLLALISLIEKIYNRLFGISNR